MPTTKLALNSVEMNYDWFDASKTTGSSLPEEIQVFTVEQIKQAGFRLSNVPRYRKIVLKGKNGKPVLDANKKLQYVNSEKLTLQIQKLDDSGKPAVDDDGNVRPALRVGISAPLQDSGIIEEGKMLDAEQIAVMLLPAGYEMNNGNTLEHDTFLVCRPGGGETSWF